MVENYNDSFSLDNKLGSCDRLNYLIQDLCDVVHDACLIHIPVEGYPFMWRFAIRTDHAIEQLLNKAMENGDWLSA